MSEKEYNIVLTTALEWIKTYDFGIVVSPTEKVITNDGFRATEKDYQWELHNYFLNVLDALGAQYIVIKGSHEERIKQVVEHLKKKGIL